MTLPKATARQHVATPHGRNEAWLQTVGSESRPQTFYTYDLRHNSQSPQDLAPSRAPCSNETRRQSFSGVTPRPTLGIQTVPLSGHDHRSPIGWYNEFGIFRRSLGRLGNIDENPPRLRRPPSASAIQFWEKKSGTASDANVCSSHEFPLLLTPGYDGNEESLYSAYTAYTSCWQSAGPRMSIRSRKAIDELVEQDRDFVAYRYPSQSQPPVDLVR